jgi:glutamate-1-semialdehyde 2,1-aminomutase
MIVRFNGHYHGGLDEFMGGITTDGESPIPVAGELEKDDGAAYRRIEELGLMLKDGLDAITRKHQQNLLLQGFPGAWTFTSSSKSKIINHKDSLGPGILPAGIFAALLKQRGVLTSFRFCTSAAHTESDVEDALQRAEDATKELAEATASA